MKFSILKSRTFWTVVVLAAYNLCVAVVQIIPNIGWVSTIINLLGIVLATYFHINPSQTYNQTLPATQ